MANGPLSFSASRSRDQGLLSFNIQQRQGRIPLSGDWVRSLPRSRSSRQEDLVRNVVEDASGLGTLPRSDPSLGNHTHHRSSRGSCGRCTRPGGVVCSPGSRRSGGRCLTSGRRQAPGVLRTGSASPQRCQPRRCLTRPATVLPSARPTTCSLTARTMAPICFMDGFVPNAASAWATCSSTIATNSSSLSCCGK